MKPTELNILKSLGAEGVRYVLIGAFAFPAHGYSRDTHDIDVFFEPTRENLGRLRRALRGLRYPEWEISDEDFLSKKILFRHFDPELDTHPSVVGAEWAGVWARHIVEPMEGLRVPCAGLDDLIAMKRAAGRGKDLEDLKYLEEIKRQKAGVMGPLPEPLPSRPRPPDAPGSP